MRVGEGFVTKKSQAGEPECGEVIDDDIEHLNEIGSDMDDVGFTQPIPSATDHPDTLSSDFRDPSVFAIDVNNQDIEFLKMRPQRGLAVRVVG